MHEIRTVVSIILAIFPVILFFKLWGMANNVKMIKRELIDNKERILVRKLINKNICTELKLVENYAFRM